MTQLNRSSNSVRSGIIWLVILLAWAVAGVAWGQTTRPTEITATRADAAVRVRPIAGVTQAAPATIANFWVHDLVDAKAIHFTATAADLRLANGQLLTFGSVVIRDCRIGPVTSATLLADGTRRHIDGILANGSNEPAIATTLDIHNVQISDCGPGVMPILIKDGRFSQITLQGVSAARCTHPVTIGGPQGDVVIDGCPGLRVALQGKPGSIGTVTVKNSPGAVVTNARDANGISPDAVITYETPATQPETAPATQPAATQPAPVWTEGRALALEINLARLESRVAELEALVARMREAMKP